MQIMNKFNQPAIVVVAYNRPNSLKRLLSSLKRANYRKQNITLIISIDFQNSSTHNDVVKLAESFDWSFGNKKIIKYTKNQGLRKHILSCGDLVNEFGSVIILEDDLYVSQNFYDYSKKALDFYNNSNEIAGVSLYNHKRNFINGIPFELIPDSKDVYFLQIASSWGQAWTESQWNSFRNWYNNSTDKVLDDLPIRVRNWPKTSWLKYFIAYLIDENKFFVYPNESLTTNFGDGGTHNLIKNVEYQVPLSFDGDFRFNLLETSLNVYDANFEILPPNLKKITPYLKDFIFTIDLYGTKELGKISTEYLLSSKKVNKENILFSYGLELKPMTLNISNEISGDGFFFAKTKDFDYKSFFHTHQPNVFNYFYSKIHLTKLFKLLVERIKAKITKND